MLTEEQEILLKGHAIELVTPCIDGISTDEDIAHHLHEVLDATSVYYCLLRLRKEGYIVYHDLPSISGLEAFWHADQRDAEVGIQNLDTKSVSVQALGPQSSVEHFQEGLAAVGVRLQPHESAPASPADCLAVVITSSYLHPELASLNAMFLETKQPWMLLNPYGHTLWLGPVFTPEKTACWQCLHERLAAHHALRTLAVPEEEMLLPAYYGHPHSDTLLSVQTAGLQLGLNEVVRWLASGDSHPLSESIITLNTHSYESKRHHLVRRPQCEACGTYEHTLTMDVRMPLSRQQKQGSAGIKYALSRNPQKTYETYKHHISPITGIVKHIRPTPTNHPAIHMYSAGHAMRPVSNRSADLPAYLRDQSAGKGRTAEQARTGALCEAIERHSGIFQGYEYRTTASLEQLGSRGMHPNKCMHFSDFQYNTREAWHQQCNHDFQRVPERFDPSAQMEWTPLASLIHDRSTYLPTAYCYFNYTGPHASLCRPDSNGNAAGNTREEAILHGLLEIIERDSVSTWWYNRLQQPSVDLHSFTDTYFVEMQAIYHDLQRELWVLDLTTDVGIPAFAALSRRIDRSVEDIIFGFGAHLDARIAIQRAITEMNQLLPFVLQRQPDGSTRYLYNGALEMKWWQTVQVDAHPYLTPSEETPRKASDYTIPYYEDVRDDIHHCLRILEDLEMDALVLDHTRPDIDMPVVKVVVPQMRIFWKRLGPGRLYTTPVRMGKLASPTPESDMNPFPFFL